MAEEIDDFRHESLQDCETIVRYINAISEGFQNGHLVLGNNGNDIVLEPWGMLKLDLKARRKDGKIKLSVKISWKEKPDLSEEESRPLIIEPKRSE